MADFSVMGLGELIDQRRRVQEQIDATPGPDSVYMRQELHRIEDEIHDRMRTCDARLAHEQGRCC